MPILNDQFVALHYLSAAQPSCTAPPTPPRRTIVREDAVDGVADYAKGFHLSSTNLLGILNPLLQPTLLTSRRTDLTPALSQPNVQLYLKLLHALHVLHGSPSDRFSFRG